MADRAVTLNAVERHLTDLVTAARDLDRGNTDISVLKDSVLSFGRAAQILLARAKRVSLVYHPPLPFPAEDDGSVA